MGPSDDGLVVRRANHLEIKPLNLGGRQGLVEFNTTVEFEADVWQSWLTHVSDWQKSPLQLLELFFMKILAFASL
jgi:hypothetical protein